jgi:hypothetical protein
LPFQVSENSVEPAPSNCRFNLLTKDCCRTALGDERKPRRPQVTLVIECRALAGGAERLAGTRACPNRSVIAPSGKPESEGPSSDPCEEMTLRVSGEIVGPDIDDGSFVNVAWRDVPGRDEVAEPLSGERIDLVVPGWHRSPVMSCDCVVIADLRSEKS